VRRHGRSQEDRYRGGMRKGAVLLETGEYERARTTFHDVAKRVVDDEDRGRARVQEGRTLVRAGHVEEGLQLFREVLETNERKPVGGEAQLAIAQVYDEAGDRERALAEYELVKEQGTGHIASQTANARRAEIQRVLDLRAAIEDEDDPDRGKNRFLLAEQLLEKLGDVDAALVEYAALAEDSAGTALGARSLYAQAWVLENRLGRKEEADSLIFRLANGYAGTEVDAAARRRLGYPVCQRKPDRDIEMIFSVAHPLKADRLRTQKTRQGQPEQFDAFGNQIHAMFVRNHAQTKDKGAECLGCFGMIARAFDAQLGCK
jgi:tetratricopeptide (TPR) repeat protein